MDERKQQPEEGNGVERQPLESAKSRGNGSGKRRWLWIVIGLIAVLVLIGILSTSRRTEELPGILVAQETELVEPTTPEAFAAALNVVIAQYDDELVIAGQRQSNRLLLEFEGSGIDLRRFPAATVISDDGNFLVIQFAFDEDAENCLNELVNMDSVLFVSMDGYYASKNAGDVQISSASVAGYESVYTQETYHSWGVQELGYDQLAAWMLSKHIGENTNPVVVAVLDTGTEPCDEYPDRVLEGISFAFPGTKGQEDRDGHGTHVGGTILDCTRGLNVQVLPVQVLLADAQRPELTSSSSAPTDQEDYQTLLLSYILQGLRFAMREGVSVINMSLGATLPQSADPGRSVSFDAGIDFYIQQALNRGIIVVASAGNGTTVLDNDGNEQIVPVDTAMVCPAHLSNAIVVGACDRAREIAPFSNYGESVDLCAPGVDILSIRPGGTCAVMSGTSQAAPHISALAAMILLCCPGRTPRQIEKYIKDYCQAAGDPLYYGEGIPWLVYFIEGDVPSEIDQRRINAGGHAGEITITMIWNTNDDLDIHCLTPSGAHIYFGEKNIGGGTLDIDRQVSVLVPEPVENIFFPTPDEGEYRVWVENYNDRTPLSSSTATVKVKVGNREKIYSVSLAHTGDKAEIDTFIY